MSLFSKILDKLGLRKDKEEEEKSAAGGTSGAAGSTARKPAASAPSARPSTATQGVGKATGAAAGRTAGETSGVATRPATAKVAAPQAMSHVDVMNMLEQKAKGTGLNWKQSISDLLALLDIDNSYDARVELAKELNAPQDVMGDSARMNTWLHKEVLRRIAENGGNIPQDLLD
jgi:hypothetical protein